MGKIEILLKMTPVEARRLTEMCFHIAEEAHDMPYENHPYSSEPWYHEDWWESLGHHIRDCMRQQEIKEEFIIGIDE